MNMLKYLSKFKTYILNKTREAMFTELAQDLLAHIFDYGIHGSIVWIRKLRKCRERSRRKDTKLVRVEELVSNEEGF